MTTEKVNCVCKLYSSKMLSQSTCIILVKWLKCNKCRHWVRLNYWFDIKMVWICDHYECLTVNRVNSLALNWPPSLDSFFTIKYVTYSNTWIEFCLKLTDVLHLFNVILWSRHEKITWHKIKFTFFGHILITCNTSGCATSCTG